MALLEAGADPANLDGRGFDATALAEKFKESTYRQLSLPEAEELRLVWRKMLGSQPSQVDNLRVYDFSYPHK